LFIVVLAMAPALHAQPREEDRRFKLGEGYERAGDLRGAARVYRELYDADPQSELYFQAVRRTYSALAMNAELLPIVETRLAQRPSDYELRITYADLLYRAGRRDEARAAWSKAVEDGNEQELVYALVAQSQTDVRAFDLAIQTYAAARDRSDDRQLFADQLAYLYGTVGRFDDAAREYIAMLGADPTRIPYVKRALASITSNPTGLAAVTQVVAQAVARNPDFEPTLELLSWLYDESGDHAGAFEVAKRLDHARNANGSSVYAYADRALRERRFDEALAALDYFLATYDRSNPLYSVSLLTYARALEERHRAGSDVTGASVSSLVERYERLADQEEGTVVAAEALLRMAHLQAEELDEPAAAATTLTALIVARENAQALPDALLLLGDLRVRSGELDEARTLYDRAATAGAALDDDEAGAGEIARLRRAELLLYRGAYKEAVDSLTELTRRTSSAVTNDALSELFLLQETLDVNDDALGQFFGARLAALQRRWKDAAERYAKAASAAPRTTLAGEAMLGRADALGASGSSADAMGELLAFVAATPDALAADRALYRAAELADRALDDRARAIELYDRVLAEYPKSQHASLARARLRAMRDSGG
jgi:tetratricopeptide (TPR) repeat protein